jgi:hypothetical protein
MADTSLYHHITCVLSNTVTATLSSRTYGGSPELEAGDLTWLLEKVKTVDMLSGYGIRGWVMLLHGITYQRSPSAVYLTLNG